MEYAGELEIVELSHPAVVPSRPLLVGAEPLSSGNLLTCQVPCVIREVACAGYSIFPVANRVERTLNTRSMPARTERCRKSRGSPQ